MVPASKYFQSLWIQEGGERETDDKMGIVSVGYDCSESEKSDGSGSWLSMFLPSNVTNQDLLKGRRGDENEKE